MRLGIAGAGRVGCSIGKYLKEQGLPVAGYFSKTKESVEQAATFTNTMVFYSIEELVKSSDILLLAVPDDSIRTVWDCIKKESIQGKIICHFSGSLSSVVFSDIDQTGAYGCSIHPMYAFNDKFTSYPNLKSVIFTMEGDANALAVMVPMFKKMGNPVCIIEASQKARYHAAASMVSNMMIALYEMGLDMFVDCGFDKEEAKQLVEPLVRGNVEAMLATSPEQALTGPIERNDIRTVMKHSVILQEGERAVYAALGQLLVNIAERKNPNRDYTAMLKILNDME